MLQDLKLQIQRWLFYQPNYSSEQFLFYFFVLAFVLNKQQQEQIKNNSITIA